MHSAFPTICRRTWNGTRTEVLGKASQKMQDVIKKLAEEKGLDVIIDAGQTLFFKPALELTAEATTAYNKANPAK